MTLTKTGLVHHVYKSNNLSKVQSAEAVEAFLGLAKSCLERGDNLLISGFGKFYVRKKNARRGRNPKTGGEMMLDARTVVKFKPAGKLRDRLNED